MSNDFFRLLIRGLGNASRQERAHGNHGVADGLVMIGIGIFLLPIPIIGLPLLIMGIWKLFK